MGWAGGGGGGEVGEAAGLERGRLVGGSLVGEVRGEVEG